MKKALVLLLFLPVVFIVTTHGQDRPTIFPGAVPQFESNEDYFLTNADYESVISYYTKEKGAPRHEDDSGDKGRSAWFLYVEMLPDDGGLYVSEKKGNSRGAARVFSLLPGLCLQKLLSGQNIVNAVIGFAIFVRFA
jgi:hypothetical protein